MCREGLNANRNPWLESSTLVTNEEKEQHPRPANVAEPGARIWGFMFSGVFIGGLGSWFIDKLYVGWVDELEQSINSGFPLVACLSYLRLANHE